MFGTTGIAILLFSLYILICWRIADSAKDRGSSALATFLLSFLLTPLVGLLIVAFSGSKQQSVLIEKPINKLEELEMLQRLKASGDITEEEYKAKVNKLIV